MCEPLYTHPPHSGATLALPIAPNACVVSGERAKSAITSADTVCARQPAARHCIAFCNGANLFGLLKMHFLKWAQCRALARHCVHANKLVQIHNHGTIGNYFESFAQFRLAIIKQLYVAFVSLSVHRFSRLCAFLSLLHSGAFSFSSFYARNRFGLHLR